MNLLVQQGIVLPAIPSDWLLQGDYSRAEVALILLACQNAQAETVRSISQSDRFIEALIRIDAKETPITLRAEMPCAENISLLIANSKSRMALYVNQQLCDEDWALGTPKELDVPRTIL